MSSTSSSVDSFSGGIRKPEGFHKTCRYYPFSAGMRQPLIYYMQIHRRRKHPEYRGHFKKSGKVNYFEKAFKWYSDERPSKHLGGPAPSRQSANSFSPGFATWLDLKYEEYLKTINGASSHAASSDQSHIDTGAEAVAKPSRKYKGKLNRRSSKSFKIILEPKDVTSRTASICHYQAATAIRDPPDKAENTMSSGNEVQSFNVIKMKNELRPYESTGSETVQIPEKNCRKFGKRNKNINIECQCPVVMRLDKGHQCPDKDRFFLKDQKVSPFQLHYPNVQDKQQAPTVTRKNSSKSILKTTKLPNSFKEGYSECNDSETQATGFIYTDTKNNKDIAVNSTIQKTDAFVQTSDMSFALDTTIPMQQSPLLVKVIYVDKLK